MAIELGITKKLLSNWRSQYRDKGNESFPGRANTAVSEEGKSQQFIKNELDRLRKENEIFKKALGIISKSDL